MKSLIGMAALMAMVSGTSWAQPNGWGKYHNDKYGYSVAYPVDFLSPEPESGSGDGRSFHAKIDNGRALVWASYDQSPLPTAIDDYQSRCSSWPAPYRVMKADRSPSMTALSCFTTSGDVIYSKAFRCRDVTTQLELTYPKRDTAAWKAVVQGMAASLSAGCGLD